MDDQGRHRRVRPARCARAGRGRRRRLRPLHQRGQGAQADLAAVSAKNDATVKRAAELKPYADFQTLAAGARQHGPGARQRPLRLGAVAARPLPRAALQRLPQLAQGHRRRGAGSGGSGSGIRGAIGSAPAIELAGCTSSQPAVADADVAPAQRAGRHPRQPLEVREGRPPSPPAGGGADAVNPCGKGSPPSFEIVVFFEKADRRRRARRPPPATPARPAAPPRRPPTPPARAPTTRRQGLVHSRRDHRRLIP